MQNDDIRRFAASGPTPAVLLIFDGYLV